MTAIHYEMKKEIINLLKEIKLGGTHPCCKETDELGKEQQNVLAKLLNFDAINKNQKGSYKSGNLKFLSKFIELQDFEKLAEYIENESDNKTGNVTYINNAGNLIQDSSFNKSPVKQDINNKTLESTKKHPLISKFMKYWWMFLITVVSGIILLLIDRGIIDIGI